MRAPHLPAAVIPDIGGPVPSWVKDRLSAAAGPEDRGEQPIARSIDFLFQAGLLREDGSADPVRTASALMQVGAANLSAGRLWEGHINALRLIRLYGTPSLKRDVNQWNALLRDLAP
ncbi:hypothetical protein [Maritimibacter sp. DP1N21-5]|uniref:hypothetical protein n=1 Tax=Maritimibacter sp. DP1N21-5 TaxID=2836867 RepID=UPI001C48AA05|nr:hypothetical protein [Maritimibacter sp. DP1N21-5]MBV7411095.1 hypothetical protein [Maritimibacter sp. DP1N21-5]